MSLIAATSLRPLTRKPMLESIVVMEHVWWSVRGSGDLFLGLDFLITFYLQPKLLKRKQESVCVDRGLTPDGELLGSQIRKEYDIVVWIGLVNKNRMWIGWGS